VRKRIKIKRLAALYRVGFMGILSRYNTGRNRQGHAEIKMKEPKQIVYEYVGNVLAPDVRNDLMGELHVPQAGTVIVHNGYWWKVIETSQATSTKGIAIYRVLLKRSLGNGRM
jgi:hypothetical protein